MTEVLVQVEEHPEEPHTFAEGKEHLDEQSPTKQVFEEDEQSEGDSPVEEAAEDDKAQLVRPRRYSLEVNRGEERQLRRQKHVRRISLPHNPPGERRQSGQVADPELAVTARSKGQALEQRQHAVTVAAIATEQKRSSAPSKRNADWGKLAMIYNTFHLIE